MTEWLDTQPTPGPWADVDIIMVLVTIVDDHTVCWSTPNFRYDVSWEIGDEVYLERYGKYGTVRNVVQLEDNGKRLQMTRVVVEVYGGTHGFSRYADTPG